jgi:predicted ATP-grasp superfamily ATP-dependent carboligase
MPRVIVTDGKLRSALAVVRSLGRHGLDVTCGAETRFATSCYSKYVDETFVYPSPERDPEGFRESLLARLSSGDVDALLPVGHHSTECVSRYRGELLEYTAVPVPARERFERAWDKGRTFEAARRASVPRPRTIVSNSEPEAEEVSDVIGFPAVIKSRSASGSRGIRYVDDEREFTDAYRAVATRDSCPLVQERIPPDGRGLGAGFLVDGDGEVRAQFAYRRLREYPPSGGPSTLRESIDGTDVLESGRRLLEELDWRGVAMVEFKRDPRDGEAKLMEVNPRFWGSLHLPLYAGVDFPWQVYRHAVGRPTDACLEYQIGVRCRYLLPGDILHLLATFSVDSVREFFPLLDDDLHYDILSSDDPRATFGRLLSMLRLSLEPEVWRKVVFR